MNVAQIEARCAQLDQLITAAEARNNTILDLCIRENRATTDDEATTLAAARDEVRNLKAEKAAHEPVLADLRAAEAAEGRATIATPDATIVAAHETGELRTARVKVGREALTYEKHDATRSYLADLIAVETGRGRVDRDEARARLEAHGAEMRVELPKIEARQRAAETVDGAPIAYEARDLTRVDGAGGFAVPPAWLMNEYITLVRAHRVTANLCRSFALPAGTDSINIPKVSTGTAAAVQTADNAAVQETDLADTSVSAGVKTIAGQQDIAIQLMDQSPIAFDQIIFGDLIADYAMKLDQQIISGSNISGQVRGIRTIASVATVSYTDASPTVPELYPKVASAINTVNTTRYLPPEVLIMHPRRWLWTLAALDSSNRPLVVPATQGPNNGLATFGSVAPEGPVGYMVGIPVYTDPNIPTTVGGGTEDVIIAARPSDYYLWEGPIRSRVLSEVLSANLTIRLQVYGYVAFMPDRRPESTCIVTGSGLASPTF